MEVIDIDLVRKTLYRRELISETASVKARVLPTTFSRQGRNMYTFFSVHHFDIDVAEVCDRFWNSTDNLEGVDIRDSNNRKVGTLRRIVPNWFAGSALHTGLGPHGPGGPPRPVVSWNMIDHVKDNVRSAFDRGAAAGDNACDEEVLEDACNEVCEDVVIYVLDTIPERCRIETATQKWPMLGCYYACILDETKAEGEAEKAKRIATPDVYYTKMATYHYAKDVGCDLSVVNIPEERLKALGGSHHNARRANAAAPLPDALSDDPYALGKHHYDSSDHGLFIAGILHLLVPKVKIHVLEVIGNYGGGTFTSFAAGLHKVIKLHGQSTAKAFINCSFTLAIPVDGHDDGENDDDCCGGKKRSTTSDQQTTGKQVAPAIPETLASFTAKHEEFAEQLNDLFTALADSIQTIGAKVFAAAGNDSDKERGKPEKETRYPAKLASVTGVGALKRDGKTPANYSNSPDQPESAGFWAFGGDYIDNAHPLPGTGDYVDSGEGIISIFTGNLNINPNPYCDDDAKQFDRDLYINPYGFAEWKGTSFATPMLVGRLAQLWCEGDQAVKGDIEKLGNAAVTSTDQKSAVATLRTNIKVHVQPEAEHTHDEPHQ